MFSELLNLAHYLTDLRGSLRRAKSDKRDRLADYFQNIAACLDSISADLLRGGHANRACSQLNQYVALIPDAVADVFGRATRAKLQAQISRARDARVAEVGSPIRVSKIDSAATSPADVQDIEEAAGMFQALADYLRLNEPPPRRSPRRNSRRPG